MIIAILLIVVGVFALGQNIYYRFLVKLLMDQRERNITNARSDGRREALNNPGLVLEAYKKIFIHTMN